MKCPKCNYVSHGYLASCRKCGADLVAFKRDIGLVVLQPGVLDLSFVLGAAGADDLFASVDDEGTLHAGHDDDFALSLDDDDHLRARRATDWVPRPGVRKTAEDRTGLEPLTLEFDTDSVALPPPHVSETVATPAERSATAEGVTQEHTEGSDDGAGGAEKHAAPPEVGEPVNTPSHIFELSADDLLLASQANEPSGSDFAAVVEPASHIVDASSSQEASLWPELELAPEASASAVEPTLLDPAMPGLDDPVLDDLALEDLEAAMLAGDLSIDLSPPEVDPEQGFTTPDALALEDLDALLLPEPLTLDLDAVESMANWASTTLDEVQLDDPPGDVQSHVSPPQDQADDVEELLLDLDDGADDDHAQA